MLPPLNKDDSRRQLGSPISALRLSAQLERAVFIWLYVQLKESLLNFRWYF